MKKYVFEEYRDGRGVGTERRFETEKEAVEYAGAEWNHLGVCDRKTYLNDKAARFWVYEIEISEEQLEAYNDDELDVPLSELWCRTIKEWR